MQNTYTIN